MNRIHSRFHLPAAIVAALIALNLAAAAFAAPTSGAGRAPIVHIDDGAVRGIVLPGGGYAFRGLPYAAPPTGQLRWRAPQPPVRWQGIRDATQFAPSCPQPQGLTAGSQDEDCLYLNVYTPQLGDGDRHREDLPVLVWIHGGGLTQGAGRDYDPTKLAQDGVVAVTINYRLGALGFLAHPALASSPGGPAGNYGLMDQQAALRWVQSNIGRFGGDSEKVTIAGESAGGLSVLAHLVSRSSRGLFQRAIVESGTFALTQQSLATAEALGQGIASLVGCSDQSAECLRNVPVAALRDNFPTVAIPGVVDGQVLTESIGTAMAAGRFARVPVLNGSNHDEERLFVQLVGVTVSQGTYVSILGGQVTPENYQQAIAVALGVTDARAAEIAAEYPLSTYPSAPIAFSTLVADASFACTALQVDTWTSQRAPTFAYEFNDDAAPPRQFPPYLDPPVATHTSELGYLFDIPDSPFQQPLTPDQEVLASRMRAAWANFAERGNPTSAAVRWPSFNATHVMSLVPPQPQVETDFVARHHCSFWVAP